MIQTNYHSPVSGSNPDRQIDQKKPEEVMAELFEDIVRFLVYLALALLAAIGVGYLIKVFIDFVFSPIF